MDALLLGPVSMRRETGGSVAAIMPTCDTGLFAQEKAPPKRGQVLVSLFAQSGGGPPRRCNNAGREMCSARAIASSPGTSIPGAELAAGLISRGGFG